MKLYTFYTDSHKILFDDWFLPSFTSTNKNIELITTKFDQHCKSGNFMEEGWMRSMHDKIDLVIRGIEENWNEYFIHSDCDVQFFGDIKSDLLEQVQDYDLAGTNDNPFDPNSHICCGFFICKGNDKTLSMFKEIKKIMNQQYNDQIVLNTIKDRFITSKKLNYKHYNVIYSNGPRVWSPEMGVTHVDPSILTHHANWIIGIENKITNLKLVKELVEKNR
jgi:hypothetical protein